MLSSSDILSIPDSSMSFSNWSRDQTRRSRSNSPPSSRGRASRRDGRHIDFGETPSSGHTKAQAHSKSKAEKRRHSSSNSSPSSDYSSSSSNSKSSSQISQKSGSRNSKTGSIEKESSSNNKSVRSVSLETVYERFDIKMTQRVRN